MNFFLTIFFLLLIISVVVSIHEFGHFFAAKLSGIPVQEFAIGFGPKLVGVKISGTNYVINLLPFGGYVQLEGENDDTLPNSFRNKKFRYKALVLLAGVFMNMVLAVVLLTIFLSSNGYTFALPKFTNFSFTNTESQNTYFPLTVTYIDPAGPSVGQFNLEDIVVGVNNVYFQSYLEFKEILKKDQNQTVSFEFLDRNTFNITSKSIRIGMADSKGSILKTGFFYDTQNNRSDFYIKYKSNVFSGVAMTYDLFFYQLKAIGSIVASSIKTGNYTEVSNNVGSIPQVANQINLVVQAKAYDFLIPLTAIFSINLAMINILPFPALDGGQLLVSFIEKVRRKKFSDSLLNKINTSAFIFLTGLGVLLILKDFIQLNWFADIVTFLKQVLGK